MLHSRKQQKINKGKAAVKKIIFYKPYFSLHPSIQFLNCEEIMRQEFFTVRKFLA
jgi:hypothetical protein